MLFNYTYRSSDGQHHTAEIEAENRDSAYARLRTEYGIKPIKVVAAGEIPNDRKGPHFVLLSVASSLAVIVVAVVVWWALSRGSVESPPPEQFTVNTPQGPITYTVASPLKRQAIRGDRQRIEAAMAGDTTSTPATFASPAERLLARFAEPGREQSFSFGIMPTEGEFSECLQKPIRIASTDFTEVIDLKRIVAGMKREMRAYLAGGGTVDSYIAELEKRQRLEISYRGNAERRLNELLNVQDAEPSLKDAYDYWLKANAQLQAMGIYPLAMPDVLRSYQMGLDIEK